MKKKGRLKPFATLKPGQKPIEIKDLGFNDASGTQGKEYKQTKKEREEQRAHRRAQNKAARQHLKHETETFLEEYEQTLQLSDREEGSDL
jgi:hypothetical protein